MVRACRPRIPEPVARSIETVQRNRRLPSFQAAHNFIIGAGLAKLGELPSASAPTDAPCGNSDGSISIPLPAQARQAIKKLAREDFRSVRGMTRIVTLEGLKALGAWPPKTDTQN